MELDALNWSSDTLAFKVNPKKGTPSIHAKNKEKKAVDLSKGAKKPLLILDSVFILDMIILYVIGLDCF
ncbi:hypothetical protein MASR2M70_05870 [Bacillota bacterium]